MTVEEKKENAYLTGTQFEDCHWYTRVLLPDTNDFKGFVRLLSAAKQQSQAANSEITFTPVSPSTIAQAGTPQLFVINQVTDYRINNNAAHPSAKIGGLTYWMQCYAFDREKDKFKPINYILRNEIVTYYKSIKQPFPNKFNDFRQENKTVSTASRQKDQHRRQL